MRPTWKARSCECRTRVTAGEHLLSATYLRNYHGLPPSYKGPEPSKRPPEPLISPRGKLTEKDIETLRKFGTKIKTDAVETRVDNRFESIDVGGPFNQATGPSPESLRRIYVCGHAPGKHTDACARTILTSFATPRFPPAGDAAGSGTSISDSSRSPASRAIRSKKASRPRLQAVLVSPNFLFRIERDRPAPRRTHLGRRSATMNWHRGSPISCGAACRTRSCFASPARATLRQPAVLAAQVRRMLRDPKSARWWRTSPANGCSSRTSMSCGRISSASRFRRGPAPGHAARDRAVPREHHPQGRQHARIARRQLHLSE